MVCCDAGEVLLVDINDVVLLHHALNRRPKVSNGAEIILVLLHLLPIPAPLIAFHALSETAIYGCIFFLIPVTDSDHSLVHHHLQIMRCASSWFIGLSRHMP